MLPRILAAVVLALLVIPAAASAAAARRSTSSTATARSRSSRARTRSRSTATTSRARSVSGFIIGFRPNLEYTNGKIPGVDVLHLHHAVWLINGQPTFAAGEEKTNVKLPRPFGWRHRARRRVGAQPHGPQPAPEPLPRLPHLHDRLHPRLLAAGEEDAARWSRAGSTSRAAAPTPSSTCTAARAPTGASPTRATTRTPTPAARRATSSSSPATACSSRPRGTCTPAGSTRT